LLGKNAPSVRYQADKLVDAVGCTFLVLGLLLLQVLPVSHPVESLAHEPTHGVERLCRGTDGVRVDHLFLAKLFLVDQGLPLLVDSSLGFSCLKRVERLLQRRSLAVEPICFAGVAGTTPEGSVFSQFPRLFGTPGCAVGRDAFDLFILTVRLALPAAPALAQMV
jgi:hypothetical protein